ncbi:MAG: RNA-binding transcriptional accessory protein [Candidatus Brocadiaceae bacterium]|nr:RNA-binding transcriptional accessory protein [Candidatus Brocadiaceae bacterium]
MAGTHATLIGSELAVNAGAVAATAALLDEGATVPFIARYRKEATGSLDEVAIAAIRDRLQQLRDLDKRRDAVLKSVQEQGKLTDRLRESFAAAATLADLEDLYLPYRPKRRTRAQMARQRGLEPLADLLLLQQDGADPVREAGAFVDAEKGVESAEEALAGARDIIAERVSEDGDARAQMRELFKAKATIRSRVVSGKEKEGAKFRDYYEWEEPAARAAGHRVLAMRRGEEEGFLYLRIAPPEEEALDLLCRLFVRGRSPCAEQVRAAVEDGYKRLLSLSMETEMRLATKKAADAEAIRVFADNLRQLLLAPPLGPKRILAIDPGFRTGCKVACLDAQGRLIHHETIFPHSGDRQRAEAALTLNALCERFGTEAIAVGNGTAGRETEAFVRSAGLRGDILVAMVDESGASVYSASEVAREEFPDLDLTVRGTVSIGRRMLDPLSELVKIDPKSVGVGQYQHDVDQAALRQSLQDVVVHCVNSVGVDVNTASRQLLTYVSGLGPKLAQTIVDVRNQRGPFRSRRELQDVPGVGPKTYQQAAGFLRIRDADDPLDGSAVHPDSYHVVEAMARDLDCSVRDLMADPGLRARIVPEHYVGDGIGMPTLRDILEELARPGRDPRKAFEPFQFADVRTLEDLRPGMRLPGIVTNITNFGAFVDVGVHQDGLVHVSELADRFVRLPAEVVKLRQAVTVTVLDVDQERRRIALSMRSNPEPGRQKRPGGPKQKGGSGTDGRRADGASDGASSRPFRDLLGGLRG